MVGTIQIKTTEPYSIHFPLEVRSRGPPSIRIEGIHYLGPNKTQEYRLVREFTETPNAFGFLVHAEPHGPEYDQDLTRKLTTGDNLKPALAAAEMAGRLRHYQTAFILFNLTHRINEFYIAEGKTQLPFKRGVPFRQVMPMMYEPYGAWKLHPEQGAFDYSTTAELTLSKRRARPGNLCDFVEAVHGSGPNSEMPIVTVTFNDRC